MHDSFDRKLRKALRPVDPGEDFTQSVIAQLPVTEVKRPYRSGRLARWSALAMAASVVVAMVIGFGIHEQRQRAAGLRARAQALEALQVTSEKLNLAYRVVRDQSQANATQADDGGA